VETGWGGTVRTETVSGRGGGDVGGRAGEGDGSSEGSRGGEGGYRGALAPTHGLVFSRPNGTPWNGSELSRTFSMAAMRVTGKKTNPHLVRDMVGRCRLKVLKPVFESAWFHLPKHIVV
jgi:hypothetical protein